MGASAVFATIRRSSTVHVLEVALHRLILVFSPIGGGTETCYRSPVTGMRRVFHAAKNMTETAIYKVEHGFEMSQSASFEPLAQGLVDPKDWHWR